MTKTEILLPEKEKIMDEEIELERLICEKKLLKLKIKEQKIRAHRKFVEQNKKFLRICDIIFVICILFNFGALILTNVMIQKADYKDAYFLADKIKSNPNHTLSNKSAEAIVNEDIMIFSELNPTASKIYGFQGMEDTSKALQLIWDKLLKWALLWTFLSFWYILLRKNIRQNIEKTVLIFILCWYFTLLSYDCLHDLGLFLGKIWFS